MHTYYLWTINLKQELNIPLSAFQRHVTILRNAAAQASDLERWLSKEIIMNVLCLHISTNEHLLSADYVLGTESQKKHGNVLKNC